MSTSLKSIIVYYHNYDVASGSEITPCNNVERLDCLIVCTVYSLFAKATLLCTYLICSLDATSRYAHIVIGPVLQKKWLCSLHNLLCD